MGNENSFQIHTWNSQKIKKILKVLSSIADSVQTSER